MPALANLKCEHITPSYNRPSDTLTSACAVFVMLSMGSFLSVNNCVCPPYKPASSKSRCDRSPSQVVDSDAQLLPDSQGDTTVGGASTTQRGGSHPAAAQGNYTLHNAKSNIMPSIPENSAANFQSTTAFPTDAAEKKRDRKRAAKERGEEIVVNTRPKKVEEHYDDCGDDLTGIQD